MVSGTGAKPARVQPPVLCVDLDGTLIRGDVLWECVLVLLKTKPIFLFMLPVWLLSGRASFKRNVAARVHLTPASLTYRQPVLDLLQREAVQIAEAGIRRAEIVERDFDAKLG